MPAPKPAMEKPTWPSPLIQPEPKRPVLEAAEFDYRRLREEKRVLDERMDRLTLDCEHARQRVTYAQNHPELDAILEPLLPVMAKLREKSDAEAPKA